MGKVFENTSKKVCIYSDNGIFRLIATRRAISENWNGITRYYGSEWYIETAKRKGYGFVPYKFSGLPLIVRKKQNLIDLLSRSVQFKEAYAEMMAK